MAAQGTDQATLNSTELRATTFQDWLKNALEASGRPLRDIAEESGVSSSGLSHCARNGNPSMETVIKLADYFNVNPASILALAGLPIPKFLQGVSDSRAVNIPQDPDLEAMFYVVSNNFTEEERDSVKRFIRFVSHEHERRIAESK